MSTAAILGARGKVPFIGPETGRMKRDGVAVFKSPHGSSRYILYSSGRPLSGLQLVSAPGRAPVVANVFTAPAARGKGFATLVFETARLDHPNLRHADPYRRTDEGDAWVQALEKKGR
jgi:hypothetical protein